MLEAKISANARVVPTDDEELLQGVRRVISNDVLPYIKSTKAEEYLVLQTAYCPNLLDYVSRGLKERQVARWDADRALKELFDARPADSERASTSELDTGQSLALARQSGDLSNPDSLAARVREVFVRRLRVEVQTRTGQADARR